jgi:signal transduction histidine kinase
MTNKTTDKNFQQASERVRELNNLTLDVTEQDEVLNSLSRLLTLITGAKFSQINIFDGSTQYTIASDGALFPPLPKDNTFCTYTLQKEAALEIPDMTKDDRVKDHDSVTGEEHIRYYYGAPLITNNEVAIGTVCIIHDDKLQLGEKKKEIVKLIAEQVTRHLVSKNELVSRNKKIQQQQSTLRKVIHDLKTPISGIIGGLSMIDNDEIDPKFRSVLEMAKQSGKNLINYVTKNLEKAISDEEESNFITASTLKKKLRSLYELQAKNKKVKLTISAELDTDEHITTLSSGDLINIIGNMISNSIKFSSKDDTVSVHIGYEDKNRDRYKVTVSDEGVGMSEKQIEVITAFEHSHSTKGTRQEEGFGIGLKEALRTLTQHDGTFDIESAEGEGTTCTLYFPRQH